MEGYFGEGWEKIYEAFNLWTEKETGCHGFQYNSYYTEGNAVYYQSMRLRTVIDTIVGNFNDAMFLAETKKQFEDVECNYIQFEFVRLTGIFDKLYKSDDPNDNQLAQDLSHDLQDKMQKYNVILSENFQFIPDFDTFTKRPELWRHIEEGEFKGYDLKGNYFDEETYFK